MAELAAGEKQKLEIVKQLYLKARFLILDDRPRCSHRRGGGGALASCGHGRPGDLTVLMISHKFREVETFARSLSVLRRGRLVGGGAVGRCRGRTWRR